jgi:hypothetical protein
LPLETMKQLFDESSTWEVFFNQLDRWTFKMSTWWIPKGSMTGTY